jgi:RND family efflux transporter MFP subunit
MKGLVCRSAPAFALLLTLALGSCSESDRAAKAGGPGTARAVPVTLMDARVREVREELYSVGRVVSRNTPSLAAEIDARVLEVLVGEGETVERGQPLMRLDTTTTELSRREAQAEIQRLRATIANEQRRVARYRDLKTRDMMPQERLDDAEAALAINRASLAAAEARLAIAEDRLSKATPLSPVNGVVERRHVSVGDYVKVGGPLITVTDTTHLRAELPFPETVGHRLRVGQAIHLESPVAPGVVVEAGVNQIRPQVGSMSRSLVVIADLENPGSWRPEATVEATLMVDRRPDAVVVPALSVVERPAGKVVYRLDAASGDRVVETVVEAGLQVGEEIEIRSGLEAGATVVYEGAHYLSDGAAISVQESGQ